MHRRYQHLNVPTEILRSVVGISDAGSITKAAASLGLSQPAMSSQIKRLESLVGGSVFQKTANGSVATDLGKIVLSQARKILEANDQLVRLRGSSQIERAVRLGLSNLYAQTVFGGRSKGELGNVSVYCNNSPEIAKGLLDGFVDIGLFLHPSDISMDTRICILREREEEITWVRSRDFVLSPGAPVPLLTWPGQVTDDLMISALERKGMIYRIAFSGPDHQAKLAATEAGLGLTVLPKRMVPSSLICAEEYYLPPLISPMLLLCANPQIPTTCKLVKDLAADFFTT